MVIPFCGSNDREMFAIEHAAMDRPGKVIDALDEVLPPVGQLNEPNLTASASSGYNSADRPIPERRFT